MSRSELFPPETWAPAVRVARALANPLQRILAVEAASGVALLAATAVALVWANAWSASYDAFWHAPIGIELGPWTHSRPLHFWINDGLMTVFFFVVGLEIRRELHEGELATVRKAALPVAAALGGMLVPAAVFAAFNAGRATAAGWAIPMATDIAFAVGVLTLLGSRVPTSWRVLLLGLAVIDDIGAILVIGAFYGERLAFSGLAIVGLGLIVVVAMRAAGVRAPITYVPAGAIVWFGLLVTGVHPTIAGVALGLLTPVRPWFGPAGFAKVTHARLDELPVADRPALLEQLAEIERARREAVSPVERLLHALHPWVAFGVMPLFALANAGISLAGTNISGDATWLFAGIVIGLALGKPLGIIGAALIASRTGLAIRSEDARGRGVALVGIVGGIGFTMSLFIAQLAFPSGPYLETAKLAILVGSGAAIVGGVAFGLLACKRRA